MESSDSEYECMVVKGGRQDEEEEMAKMEGATASNESYNTLVIPSNPQVPASSTFGPPLASGNVFSLPISRLTMKEDQDRDDMFLYNTAIFPSEAGNDGATSEGAAPEGLRPVVVNPLNKFLRNIREGEIEKLVGRNWTTRYLHLSPFTRTLTYYVNQRGKDQDKPRGIYPLLGAKVTLGNNEGGCNFSIILASGQTVKLRTGSVDDRQEWCDHLTAVATMAPHAVKNIVEGEVQEATSLMKKRRWAVVDPRNRTFALYASVIEGKYSKLLQDHTLVGATVVQEKSYGSYYDFTVTSRIGKKLKLRTENLRDWYMWCEAIFYCSLQVNSPQK